ncbi:hypothetical protein ABE38_22880 [Brevibacillus agri]|nr:hypothetical protein [Brevibacillus agri]
MNSPPLLILYTALPLLRGWPLSIGTMNVYIFGDLESCSSSEMYTFGNAGDKIRTCFCIHVT